MSFLPGLGPSTLTDAPPPTLTQSRTITLKPGTEWRFEVSFTSTTTVKLLPSPTPDSTTHPPTTGTAELFGTELAPNREYVFRGTKAAIYTHHGCALAVTGTCESEYVAEETPVAEYLNVHLALEDLRAEAAARLVGSTAAAPSDGGPRVLVVGPDDAGKTSLVRTLAAYAQRAGRTPLLVNLDPHEGMLALPGSVSAAVLGSAGISDIEDAAGAGWGSSPIGGPSLVPVKMPLVYHIGCAGPEERLEVFKPVTTRLALAATSRFEDDAAVKVAGMLVDTAGSASAGKAGYEVLMHVISEFSINVVLVLGSERLYSDLSRRLATPIHPSDAVRVLKLAKSGGCVDRDEGYMRALRQAQVRAYFFGTPASPLSPHTQLVDADALAIFRTSDAHSDSAFDATFLPGGAADDDDANDRGAAVPSRLFTRVTPLPSGASPPPALANAVLAVKYAAPNEPDEAIRDASVMGYLYVADVDEAKRKLRILAPVGGRLPARALVWGSWPEGVGDLVG